MAKRQTKRDHFRFVAPDGTRGKWRVRWAKALTDAVEHHLTPAEPIGRLNVKILVDVGVAAARLPDLKAKGYSFERVVK